MKTTVIMVRHGESESNKKSIFTGQMNTELTELGLRQAELAAEALKNVHIDRIYASDLSRAYNTGLPIAKSHGLEIEKNKGLREIFAGDWEGLGFDEIKEKFTEDYNRWREDIGHARCTGGESIAELYDRVVGEVIRLAEENPGKTICLASHATPVRTVCAASSGIRAEELHREPFPGNASISIFEYENGRLTAKVKGDVTHLADLATFLSDRI